MGSAPRMRVLIHPFFFLAEDWNGMDEHLLLLANHVDRTRFELLVLAHTTDGNQTQRLAQRAGLRAVSAPYGPDSSATARLRGLRHLYASERVDLLHMHSPVAGGQFIPALAARLSGVQATVATYHQIQAIRPPARTRAVNYATHARLIDATIAVSRGVQDTLISAAGLPARRVRTVLNGIDPWTPDPTPPQALPERKPGEVWIGYFGRLSPEKGVADLVESLALLVAMAPDARTLIVGDGPARADLEALTWRLGLQDRVHFLGFRRDARSIMPCVDIVAHVPVYEGFGLVILEAMVASRAVVTNDAPGGMTEIVVHEETGLIVPAGSRARLAEALAQLVSDQPARQRLGANGRRRWEQHFSAEQMARSICAIYEQQVSRGPTS